MSENVTKWFRIILGLFLIIYALNQFLHFFPTSYGDMPDNARAFIDAVVMYLPALYIAEILVGLMLLANKWTAFWLVVLVPLSVSFLIFNFANKDMGEMWPAFIVAFLNIYLIFTMKDKYKTLFN